MTTPLYDEAHALPAENAIRVGAAIQHIVAHETGVAETIDPLAGSYYVETLTKQMEDAAFAEMDRIFAMGGALKAIETGYIQRALGREQYERNKDIEEGRRKWVGVNHLGREDEAREIEIFRLDDAMEEEQVRKVRGLRARRDQPAVDAALEKVREAARTGANMVPPCLEAVKLYATHGEICNAMRDVFGVHSADSQLMGI
jgi:methylmalonyl-CoA mutase N-terminal domain/subunit